jgi:hypothetical protein
MRYWTILLTAALFCGPAMADQVFSHGDLVCSQKSQTALLRFTFASDENKPVYPRLPAGADEGLSAAKGSDRTDCTLPGGRSIRVRFGSEQAMAYGAGGGDPPEFFSLWIDGRKVLSRKEWKPGYGDGFDEKARVVVGLVIKEHTLTWCTRLYDNDRDAPACRDEVYDLKKYPVDTIEYSGKPKPKPGTITVADGASDPAFCKARLAALKNLSSYEAKFSDSIALDQPDKAFADVWQVKGQYPNLPHRTVYMLHGEDHYFDGDIVLVTPDTVKPAEIATFSKNLSLEKAPSAKLPKDWGMIAGGTAALYPDVSPRYVHFGAQNPGGMLHLTAHPTNTAKTPAAVILKPEAPATPACVFNEVAAHY